MNIPNKLKQLSNEYPKDSIEHQIKDVPRISFNIELCIKSQNNKSVELLEICDIGGGLGLFTPGCAALGFKKVVLIDDFGDHKNHKSEIEQTYIHNKYGVEIHSRDVIEQGLPELPYHFDIITSFDSMEHWHNSPKHLFHQVMDNLKDGGTFVLGVPNCVNLRKRLTVPLGFGKWSSMQQWYEVDIFRGHVREPDISDLKYIASDMGLKNVRFWGRNWLGYKSPHPLTRSLTKMFDTELRLFPALCADLYMVGTK